MRTSIWEKFCTPLYLPSLPINCCAIPLPIDCLHGVPLLRHELQAGLGQVRVPTGNVEAEFDDRDAEEEVLRHEDCLVPQVQLAGQAPALGNGPGVTQRCDIDNHPDVNTAIISVP